MSDSTSTQLWQRIASFEFDEGRPQLTFARRLARENGWSADYAARVIKEYRRFAYLSVVAGHPVSPSDGVDQAWHLHLTYTRSYWLRFCREVLGRDLHHEPTRGGLQEAAKHEDWYARTLASYEQHFGEPAPSDLWPPASVRFIDAGKGRWVDTARHLVVRKSSVLLCGLIALLLIGIAVLNGCAVLVAQGPQNPFNLGGPDFLKLYIGLMVAGVVTGLLVQLLMPYPADESDSILQDPYAVACLAHGPHGAVIAALSALVDGQCLEVELDKLSASSAGKSGRLFAKRRPPLDAPDIEQRLYDAIADPAKFEAARVRDAYRAAMPAIDEYLERLKSAGLIQPNSREPGLRRWLPTVAMAAIATFGGIKICVGVARERPVGILVLLVIVAAIVALLFLMRTRLSPAGRRVLEKLRGQHQRLQSASSSISQGRLPDDSDQHRNTILAVSLFGMTALAADSQFSSLRETLQRDRLITSNGEITSATAGAGGCGGNAGGGGCGGGGCGGGGCGGGGCGGGCGGCSG